MTTSHYLPLTGNTYPVKDKIKAIGGRWDAERKVWMVPAARIAEAHQIVASAPKGFVGGSSSTTTFRRPRTCRVCGYVERRNARGYIDGDRILRSGECQSCYEERRMGY